MNNEQLLKLVNSYLFYAFWRNIFSFGFIPANPVIRNLYTYLNEIPRSKLNEEFVASSFYNTLSQTNRTLIQDISTRRSGSILSIIRMALGLESANSRVEKLETANNEFTRTISGLAAKIAGLETEVESLRCKIAGAEDNSASWQVRLDEQLSTISNLEFELSQARSVDFNESKTEVLRNCFPRFTPFITAPSPLIAAREKMYSRLVHKDLSSIADAMDSQHELDSILHDTTETQNAAAPQEIIRPLFGRV